MALTASQRTSLGRVIQRARQGISEPLEVGPLRAVTRGRTLRLTISGVPGGQHNDWVVECAALSGTTATRRPTPGRHLIIDISL